jgi:hypothetical protein
MEYLKNENVKTLREICKLKKINNYSKSNKEQLIEKIKCYFAVRIIQKNYRNHFYKSAVDHITLEQVKYPCFIFKTKLGKFYFYNYESIIKYIMKTGNTKDPMTRIQYSDEDLIRLDLEVKKHFPDNNYKSCYKIKKNINYSRRIRNRENEILSYQMRLDEIKTNILVAIESDIFSWDFQGEIVIDNIEYPSINSYINSILHEFKLIIINLRSYDHSSANYYKTTFIESINNIGSDLNINTIVQKIQNA